MNAISAMASAISCAEADKLDLLRARLFVEFRDRLADRRTAAWAAAEMKSTISALRQQIVLAGYGP